jgi:hypothetical protein
MRSPNRTPPTRPGVLLTLRPHERAFLKENRSRGGYQDLENWLLEATRDGPVFLDPVRLERLLRCCDPNRYGSGGPNGRLRSACIPALRRVGIDLQPEWRAP